MSTISISRSSTGSLSLLEPPSPVAAFEPARLDVELTIEGDVAQIAVRGELDHGVAPELCRLQRCVLARGVRSVVIDCSGLTFMDAGGINAILELCQFTAGREGTVSIQAPPPHIRRLLAITGVDAMVTIQ